MNSIYIVYIVSIKLFSKLKKKKYCDICTSSLFMLNMLVDMMKALSVSENMLRNKLIIIEMIGQKEHVLCYAV